MLCLLNQVEEEGIYHYRQIIDNIHHRPVVLLSLVREITKKQTPWRYLMVRSSYQCMDYLENYGTYGTYGEMLDPG
ncbi:32626ff3-0078-4c9e-a0b4-c5722fa28b7f [Sclerotinia trifoliorum]|uniref:32626ff3-0078-4c9e-a0b4-c5722fa28b7f n=1 Tax=Sclerotinia trifoliorum TaxID=28548 RepID=A0A8H2VZL6_9HELO|nr:32626ff3-0078-4c9e-a0b4-c5722fa28b7f [Sclerotinia trifoliorum]